MEMLVSESGVDWMSLDLDQVIDTFFASGILVALLVPLPKCAERLIGDSGMTTRNISLAALTMDSLQSIFPAYTEWMFQWDGHCTSESDLWGVGPRDDA